MTQATPSITGRTALVTGASSGIGRELARLFAADGHDLVLIARSANALHALADELREDFGVHANVIAKDLFAANAARELYRDVRSRGLTIDYLVNDAGQGTYGKFVETDLDPELALVQLNVIAPLVLTKLFLRDMVARRYGRILQVASAVSTLPAPYEAVYAGTKAFIYNFTQSVVDEIKGTGVTMTALRPGATDTDFFHKSGAEESKLVQDHRLGSVQKVARSGYTAMMKGRSSGMGSLQNRIITAVGGMLPEQLVAAAVRRRKKPRRH